MIKTYIRIILSYLCTCFAAYNPIYQLLIRNKLAKYNQCFLNNKPIPADLEKFLFYFMMGTDINYDNASESYETFVSKRKENENKEEWEFTEENYKDVLKTIKN